MNTQDQGRGAEQLLAERRRRDQVFAKYAHGFGEPAWDLLLALSIANAVDGWVPPEQLITGIDAPKTVIVRYLRWLEKCELVVSGDAGVRLAESGRTLMNKYLTEGKN